MNNNHPISPTHSSRIRDNLILKRHCCTAVGIHTDSSGRSSVECFRGPTARPRGRDVRRDFLAICRGVERRTRHSVRRIDAYTATPRKNMNSSGVVDTTVGRAAFSSESHAVQVLNSRQDIHPLSADLKMRTETMPHALTGDQRQTQTEQQHVFYFSVGSGVLKIVRYSSCDRTDLLLIPLWTEI